MKRSIYLSISFFLLLTACYRLPSQQKTQTPVIEQTAHSILVTDALGREITFSAPPQRMVITGKALTLVADAVYIFPEASERVIALGKSTQGTENFIALIDPTFDEKAVIEQDASAEQIAALKPDLVIYKSYLAETLGKPVEALGIPVIYVDFETPEQYMRDLAILGSVFQNETRAQQAISYYQDRADRIQQAVKDITDKPKVLMLYYSDRDGKVAFNVPPLSWIQTRMVEIAGAVPTWSEANLGKGWTQVTIEQIAVWDADFIFIISYNQDPAKIVANLKNDPQWQALRAVQDGRLFAFAGDIYSWDQPDTRWILGLTWLAGKLHPERFPDLDILNETSRFYHDLYGLDQAFVDKYIRPAFKGDLP